MDDVIRLLPDSVANQIAAGEVIQRPASVVKELVENSIDAGAKSVLINIKDAGRTLIQIVDDGCGMSTTDARMAFERHATSKIRQASDLFYLHTMGFRGEALPSVAAVSEIDMRTMRRDDDLGTHIEISASKVLSQIPEAMVPGTNIMVKHLFFNLPARRKFLKKDAIELSHIVKEFERLALVNSKVEFTLSHNDVILHKLSPGTLKSRIIELFGKTFEHSLLPLSTDTTLVSISGFVGSPDSARKRNAQQFFFVNGRYMRHPYFHKAVLKCYEELIPSDLQPNYFINFTVDPDTIDVNIHPQKYEIKFENEQPVWQILTAAVKEALGRFCVAGTIDFNVVDMPEIPTFNPDVGGAELIDTNGHSDYNPFDNNYKRSSVPSDWDKLYETFTNGKAQALEHVRSSAMNRTPSNIGGIEIENLEPETNHPRLIEAEEQIKPKLLQIGNRYIVSPSRAGMMLIDQYRAHTLVLYNRYINSINGGEVTSQRLIFPDSITLDAAGNVVMSTITDMLVTMGFDISDLGDNAWAINAVPSIIGNANPAEALNNIIASIADETGDSNVSHWQKLTLSVARSGAIKYGTPLNETEMDQLVSDLLRIPEPTYTPDGRRVIKILDISSINQIFS